MTEQQGAITDDDARHAIYRHDASHRGPAITCTDPKCRAAGQHVRDLVAGDR